MTIVRYRDKIKGRKVNYGNVVSIRIDTNLLERFKQICGKDYHKKIRELMQMYIDAYDRKMNDK